MAYILADADTKKLLLHNILGCIPTVKGDEGTAGKWTGLMYAMGHPLLASAAFSLEQDMAAAFGKPHRLVLDGVEAAALTHQGAKAVFCRKACCMGHHGTEILNRHGYGHHAADIVVDVLFKRHHRSNILVGLGLGNPGYLLVVAGHSLKAGINGRMTVVYYHIAKAVGLGSAILIVPAGHADAFQPFHA